MIGLEPTFDEHLENLVGVFREVRRVLRKDGVLWVNYGSCYATSGTWPSQSRQNAHDEKHDNCYKGLLNCPASDCVCSRLCGECQDAIRYHHRRTAGSGLLPQQSSSVSSSEDHSTDYLACSQQQPSPPEPLESSTQQSSPQPLDACLQEHSQEASSCRDELNQSSPGSQASECRGCGRGIRGTSEPLPPSCYRKSMGLSSSALGNYSIQYHKPKDLINMPAFVAEALRADGWYLRSEMCLIKKNPLPESVTDRPTTAHEKMFMFTKSARYFYDHIAVRTPIKESSMKRISQKTFDLQEGGPKDSKEGPRSHRRTLENFAKSQSVPKGWASSPDYEGQDARHPVRENPTYGFDRATAQSDTKYDTEKSTAGRLALLRQAAREQGVEYAGSANMRNVMHVATYSYREAHFATYPPSLIEPFVKAGTSEHGCCSKCGAPWVRDAEVQYKKNRPSAGDDPRSRSEDKQAEGSISGEHGWKGNNLLKETATIGWLPSCGCEASVSPCTVLDPFAGSGTTGLVADRLQRDAVLVEISADYADMARRRIQDDAGMFTDITVE